MLDQLFAVTKQYYKADQLFGDSEKLRVSVETFRRIVKLLERFNLSDTGDDVKGLAFENFLGQTYRGELGQFFTPRPVVEFMIDMLDPHEGEVACDPASGTGGFLIKLFECIRENIERDVQVSKSEARERLASQAKEEGWSAEKLVEREEMLLAELNRELDSSQKGTRLYRVSHECIFGLDAEPRAARTSKMNMIMHGDGHGGIHYFDGLMDVNGVYPGRFDLVITNPPFGSTVGKDQIIGATEQTRPPSDPDFVKHCRDTYGQEWERRYDFLLDAARARMPVLELFDIGRNPTGGPIGTAKVRPSRDTEMLFLERCLTLLKPGGRMGIVLPDGILNNPSNSWLREYVVGRAKLLAVVSLPQEVFQSAKATVKTSLVFLQKLEEDEEADWATAREQAVQRVDEELKDERDELVTMRAQAVNLRSSADSDEQREATLKLSLRLRNATRESRTKAKVLFGQYFREKLDYPVFMAEAETAGITGSGETGAHVPNQLPAILAEYRRFRADPGSFVAQAVES